jgi:hypothetical protein
VFSTREKLVVGGVGIFLFLMAIGKNSQTTSPADPKAALAIKVDPAPSAKADPEPARAKPAPAPAKNAPSIKLPPLEESFISIVSAADSQSLRVENEMQRYEVKTSRDHSLCSQILSPSPEVSDWVGTVTSIGMNSDGMGTVFVQIAPNITIATGYTALVGIESEALIEPGSPVFQSASTLKEGELVRFSGTFLADGHDCVYEDIGNFIFRFSNISPSLVGQQQAIRIPSNTAASPKGVADRNAQSELVRQAK